MEPKQFFSRVEFPSRLLSENLGKYIKVGFYSIVSLFGRVGFSAMCVFRCNQSQYNIIHTVAIKIGLSP